jgi:CRP/FNR family cyclic AMP-dependent transcriptional regulator
MSRYVDQAQEGSKTEEGPRQAERIPVDLIRKDSVLGSLPEQDLLALLRQSPVRALPKNRVLFRSGDEGRSVVLILQGHIKLSTMASNGREVVLEIAGPGTIFGELAVLNGSPRRADATALTACRVMAFDGAQFRKLVGRTPEAMFAAIRLLSARLSAITEQGMDAVSLPAPARLAKALLHLTHQHSGRLENGVQIRLSQRELGAMTGLIRESINKHLNAWLVAGRIELVGGSVTLCDVRALQRFVQDHEVEPRVAGATATEGIGQITAPLNIKIPQATESTAAADDEFARRSAKDESYVSADLATGLEALDAHTNDLLAVVQRASLAASRRGNEIDAVLAKIHEITAQLTTT